MHNQALCWSAAAFEMISRRASPSSRYELHNFNNAVEILSEAYQQEYLEIIDALEHMNISIDDIAAAGGNESKIPKKFSGIMRNNSKWQYGCQNLVVSS